MTTQNSIIKPPVWFWIVSVIALIWNLMGAMAYLGQAYMTDEMKSAMTTEQQELMNTTPAWVTAAFAIAVWGGLLGCIALLLRKKWAKTVFVISLIAIVVQMSYSFFMTNAAEVYGTFQGMIMPLMIILVAIALLLFSKSSIAKGWIS